MDSRPAPRERAQILLEQLAIAKFDSEVSEKLVKDFSKPLLRQGFGVG